MKPITTSTQSWLTKLTFALSITIFLIACEEPNGIGLEFQGKLPIETFYNDSLKVNSSTVWQDSSFTSGAEGVVIGRYEDPILGDVTASGYTLVNLPLSVKQDSIKFNLNTANYVYDSASLLLKYNKFLYGDTTAKLKLSVYRMTGKLNETKRYIGSESIEFDPIALGSREFGVRDLKNLKGDSTRLIRIKLSDDFARNLWSISNKAEGTDLTKFSEFLKGLVIIPSAESKMCANFIFSNSTSVFSSLTLYSHEKDKTEKYSTDFTLTRTRFSNIKSSLEGLPIEKRFAKGKMSQSKDTNNRTYVQGGSGLTTRIEIPNLASTIVKGKVAINRAEIIVEPAVGTYNDFLRLPTFLQMTETATTDALQVYRNAAGVPFVATNAGYDSKTNQYVFNITDYAQKLSQSSKSSSSFIITIPTNDEAGRVILNASNTKIKLYYTVSNN